MKLTPLSLFVFFGMSYALLVQGARAAEPDARITVQADKLGANISPLLYGIFFEEINRAGDGGLYAEMLQNRSFEDGPTPLGWSLGIAPNSGTFSTPSTMSLDTSKPLNANNRTSLKVTVGRGSGFFDLCNRGFNGAPYNRNGGPRDRAVRFDEAAGKPMSGLFVEKGKEYRFSMYVRSDDYRKKLHVAIEAWDDKVLAASKAAHGHKASAMLVLAEDSFDYLESDWKKFEATLTPNATAANAWLVVWFSADKPSDVGVAPNKTTVKPSTLYFDMVSLMPKDTFKGHATRKDLTQMLADMRPSFVRFPGGCYVEGDRLAERFQWKKSIGDIAQRPGHYNLWGYYSNDGLGYHEYLQLCEDIGAEPLFVINCGMAHRDHVPMDKMDEYVQDALDAIEYANGPAESKWGSLRAKAGHPAPFHLKLMEIGNENGGPIYNERYALFYDAIKRKYPEIKLVVPLWQGMPRNRPIDLLDEHYYNSPEYFFAHTRQYDTYDRDKYKVYVGEYAVTSGCGRGNLIAGVAEAAFMTGMEPQRRRGGHVLLRPALRPPGLADVEPQCHRLRFQPRVRHAVLLGAGDVRGKPGRSGGRRFHRRRSRRIPAWDDRRRHLADAGRVQGYPCYARRQDALHI